MVFTGKGLYCYRCSSNHPGCGTPLNWLWYWGETCPEYDDKCVKIIERKGGVCFHTHLCLYLIYIYDNLHYYVCFS